MKEKIQNLAKEAGFTPIQHGDHITYDMSTKENICQLSLLILQTCDNTISKLRGFSGTLDSGEVIDSDTWNLAMSSVRAEIQFLIEEIQHDQSNQ
jgi:hypothetical protein